jgi:hypothetical protein
MARTSKKGPQFHLKPLANLMGLREVVKQLGAKELLDEVVSQLSKADRAALWRRIEQPEPTHVEESGPNA